MTFDRVRAIGSGAVAAIISALLTISVLPSILGSNGPTPRPRLIAGTDFTITSTISSSSSSAVSALLYPGAQRYLVYTVKNNLTVPIKVTSLSIATISSPTGCAAAANLDTTQTTYTAPLATALLVNPSPATSSVIVPIKLNDAGNQSPGCENKTFSFTYAGTAYPQYGTSTALASTPNPSTSPQSVTLTATVVPSPTPPSAPTGSVQFLRCSTSACTSTSPLGSSPLVASGKNGVATLSTTSLPAGNNFIKAVYVGDENFSSSFSSTLTQLVYSSCITGNQNGNLTVNSGQFICVTGKVIGTATVKSGGSLYVTGGTINDTVTVAGGSLFVAPGGTINGSIAATSPTVLSVCGAQKVNGSISVSGSPNMVVIGDGTSSCGGNDINGPVTLTSNTAGYKVIGNKINGALTATNNVGPASATGTIGNNNKINGNLACSGNNPAPTNGGQPNSVNGTRSGQCGAPNF